MKKIMLKSVMYFALVGVFSGIGLNECLCNIARVWFPTFESDKLFMVISIIWGLIIGAATSDYYYENQLNKMKENEKQKKRIRGKNAQ